MNKSIINSLSRTFHKVGFKVKKHSPEILIVAGVAGTITSAVMACKATTKLSDILDNAKEDIDKIHEGIETGEIMGVSYPAEDGKKDLSITYIQTGLKVAKLYAPSVALGVLSLTAVIASNNIRRKRNIALAAASATIDKSFKEYRGRVVERFGKELDRELRYNIKAKEIEETVVDEKTGKEKKVKKTVNVVDPNTYSDYARIYDCGNIGWSKDPEQNLMFLRRQQEYFNDKLKAQGYLFLNEVYESLGFQKTKAGQMVGWTYDEEHPNGDNFVDFGIYDSASFVNGYERSIILDFNVDGVILDLM